MYVLLGCHASSPVQVWMSIMILLCGQEVVRALTCKMQLLQVHASHYSQLSQLPTHAAYILRLHFRIQQVPPADAFLD